MLLGALMKQLKTIGIISPRPTAPFDGLSIGSLRDKLKRMESPTWYTRNTCSHHRCTLDVVGDEVSRVAYKFRGLKRKDFVDRGETGAE